MKFITNKISTGKATNFADLIASYRKTEVIKTASVDKEVKTAAEKKDEGVTSGQPKAEEKLVNHPERDDVPGSGGSAKQEEAKSSGQPEAEGKLTNNPKKDKEAEVKAASEVKEALTPAQEKLPEALRNAIKAKEEGSKGSDEKEEKGEKEHKENKEEEKKEEKESKSSPKFIRIANLDSKSKALLSKYWRTLYPEAFVDAMVADK